MTISSETRVTTPAVGNGVTTVFAFTFKVFATSDLVVKETTDAGVESTLVETTDYVVTLNADQDINPGGSIELTNPLTTDYLLTMTSAVPNLQATKITNLGGFYPAILNAVFDRLTILVQQALVPVDRSLKIPISDGIEADELPTKTLRANKALVFDADGNPGVSVGDYADPAVYANAAAASAAAALVSENNAETAEIAAEAAQAAAEAAQAAAEAAAAGVKWRPSVRVATTANITLSGEQTIDGISVVSGNRVLVKNQSTTHQNGVYLASSGAWSRATDADTWDELISQAVIVEEGDANAAAGTDLGYICTINSGGTLGVTAVTWANFNPPSIQLASQAEAEAGAENTKYLSALRVYQAIQALTKGAILQIQQTIDNTTTSISATTSTQAFGPSVTITPQRATSKIRLSWHFVYQAVTADRLIYSTLLQGGSAIAALSGASPGSRQAVTGGEGATASKPCVYSGSVIIDATDTSARTYAMGVSVNVADTVYLNRSNSDTNASNFWRSASWITAEEISQ